MPTYDERFAGYITEHFALPDPRLAQIRAALPQLGLPAIAITAEEGRFLEVLVRASGARRIVEIGTLGGYSGLWLARGLPPGGRLITLEQDPRHAQVASEHFAQAGLADRVEVRLGDARQRLSELAPEGPFDFCLIDADKPSYNLYLDWALANVRVGGVIAAHNAFRRGAVLNPPPDDQVAVLMRAFNLRFATEPRLAATIYPAGDGTLVGVVLEP
jgi:caffeoyl-CoA O-methyltransferase